VNGKFAKKAKTLRERHPGIQPRRTPPWVMRDVYVTREQVEQLLKKTEERKT
jgi:hypothetical protein